MKKTAVMALMLCMAAVPPRSAGAKDGFQGVGIYNNGISTLSSIRLGFVDQYYFDAGVVFSTNDASNFDIGIRGISRFMKIGETYIHGGALITLADFGEDTAFQIGGLVGGEAFVNDSFSITADVIPLLIATDGETDVYFLRGAIGINLYLN